MRLAFEIDGVWSTESYEVALRVPPDASSSTLVTLDGWTLSLSEFTEGDTAYLVATMELAGETATVRVHCPAEQLRANRPRLLSALRTARPSWPGTILLTELLALPATDR